MRLFFNGLNSRTACRVDFRGIGRGWAGCSLKGTGSSCSFVIFTATDNLYLAAADLATELVIVFLIYRVLLKMTRRHTHFVAQAVPQQLAEAAFAFAE